MTTWQRSSALDLALWLATVTMVTALCLATTAARACPEPCQCTQTYYVYCQRLGLTSDRVLELVTSVPREALLLDLSSNALDRLGSGLLDSLPNLEYLYVDDNLLSSLGAGLFRYQRSLRELSLTGNRLRGVRGDVFANVTSLRKLRLDGNAIEKIDARAFSSLTQLRELHVPRNNLTRLALSQLSGLAGLRVLDLSDNWINTVEVGAFRDLAGLQSLRLSRNRLSSLAEDAFRGLSSLRELHLDGNLLPSLDCFHVPHLAHSLHTLVLSGNALVSVPHDVFPKLAGLKVLALDRNLVSSVGPMAFRDLQLDSLSLAHNLLEGVDRQMLEGCRRVSRLDLSHNRIRTVRTGAFDSVRESVYVLNLAGNGLSSLDHGTLRGMRHLLALNLSSNGLSSILLNFVIVFAVMGIARTKIVHCGREKDANGGVQSLASPSGGNGHQGDPLPRNPTGAGASPDRPSAPEHVTPKGGLT
ncbi:uncharacterized protein LOC143291412 [Babylonia areolata]|uniref:uncharacterized protein LOC143291412 n=1 Tax=Babylonia areolata TaxID=304850 RepID=UPI003FD13D18